jgi:hypothetical protein
MLKQQTTQPQPNHYIAVIWNHILGKVLISLIVLVLLYLIFSASIFNRPIDLWGLKINKCTEKETVYIHDTIYSNVISGGDNRINQGDNKGIVGDVNINNIKNTITPKYVEVFENKMKLKQRKLTEEEFAVLIKGMDFKDKYLITYHADYESEQLAFQIFKRLQTLGYKIKLTPGKKMGSNGTVHFTNVRFSDSSKILIVETSPCIDDN